MKKLLAILLCIIVFYLGLIVFVKSTHFNQDQVFFEYKNEGLSQLADSLVAKKIIYEKTSFLLIAKVLKVEDKIKAGKFLVKRKTSVLDLIRMLRNNRQATVKLVLNKVRTKGEFAKLIATAFEKDSTAVMAFLSSNDSLKGFDTDTTQLFTLLIPNTYEFYWSSSMAQILGKLQKEQIHFWSQNNRIQKAATKGLTKNQIYTLASIVEEETNYDSDKSLIASVYQNRLKKQMPLQACPTIKYAMQDFTITRIYEKYLSNASPYNTYRVKGLPPGPICTPAAKTIDLVLEAPKTDYIYFVAKADFSGYHHFSNNYAEHDRYAKEYQKKLDEYQAKKAMDKNADGK
ncbi:MAG: endolytic transglycosylase MltG [Chitinophagia bacterium]